MTAPEPAGTREWEIDIQSPILKRWGIGLALLILLIHGAWAGILMINASTLGVRVGIGDQLAFLILGLIFAGLALRFLLYPRLRAGAEGIEVRGFVFSWFYPWDDVYGVSLPASARCVRLELAGYEYQALWALPVWDKDVMVRHFDEYLAVQRRYLHEDD